MFMFMFMFSRKARQILLVLQPSRPIVGKSAGVMFFRLLVLVLRTRIHTSGALEEDLNTAEEKDSSRLGEDTKERGGGGEIGGMSF